MEAIGRTGGENKAKAFQKKLKTMENVRGILFSLGTEIFQYKNQITLKSTKIWTKKS